MRSACALLLAAAAAAGGETELRHDSGEKGGHQSSAGTGHVIAFDAPAGAWWLGSVALHGARYGHGYDPAATDLTVTICDADLKPLAATTARYDLFAPGRFAWVDIAPEEPLRIPGSFKVVVEFRPTATRGVYLGWSPARGSHSSYGVPGGRERPFERDREWMIRVRLTSKKPAAARKPEPKPAGRARYLADFDDVAETVRSRFPALAKKGVDWPATCREWRPRFAAAKDDREHVLNAHGLLARLGDMHTGVVESRVEPHIPSFDGLYGAGLWIAADRGRLVLRAAMDGHPLLARLRPGAELLLVDGRPAKLVHRAVRAQAMRWHGWSSSHFLDARLSFQFFPFGEKERLSAAFLDPSGEVVEVELERWGPGGRGLSLAAVTMPEGVAAEGLAVSCRLDGRAGYVRILGAMDEATREAFDAALDRVRGVEGIVLDGRGMGGGGDGPAWAMAGRFFAKRTPQGSAPPLGPTGEWQFDGPVVFLQDERMVSSAETFAWAMTETGRALSVGRPTGGATIIPDSFEAPSGLFRFRLGCHDRKTPIRGVQPEGIGTRPDILVPHEPALLAKASDPVLATGRAALDLLLAGNGREEVIDRLGHPPIPEAVDWEIRLIEEKRNPMPDFAGAIERLTALAALAREEGDPALADRAREATRRWGKEAAAQREIERLLDRSFPPGAADAKALVAKHRGTRWAEALSGIVD